MKHRIALCAIALLALTGARRRAIEVTTPLPELRMERSFAITDKSILAGFTLDRVLGSLIAHSVAPSMTGEQFFRQMFDTQNPGPGLDASMPHCDDELLGGKAAKNGFLRRCPTPEGALAREPFRPEQFTPTALINRFDMADASGATCGQYRILFSRNSDPRHFVNLIFEGALRNPRPDLGLAACRPVARFWADLSAVDAPAGRRARLEAFFYEGVEGFPPLLHPDHFRDAPHGIRNMHRIEGANARFYQLRVASECPGGVCRVFVKPDVLENVASATLLDVNDTSPRAVRYREFFLGQIASLTIRDASRFFMTTPSEFLMAEDDAPDGSAHRPMIAGLSAGAATGAGRELGSRIDQAIRNSGSEVTVPQLMYRATFLTCEGCHVRSTSFAIGDGVLFPSANVDYQHVARNISEAGDEGETSRHSISPAMRVFIPNRMRILTEFLTKGKAPEHSH